MQTRRLRGPGDYSFDLHRFAVQEKSLLGIETKSADAERRFVPVASTPFDCAACDIANRSFDAAAMPVLISSRLVM
jgi:hypothetical protein